MGKTKLRHDLTEGRLLPKIITFTLPLIATAVLQQLFNTADTVVVGRWGGDTKEACNAALAAVGSCGSLTNLITGLFMGLAVGAGVCVAHDIGAKQYKDVEETVHTSVLASLMCGLLVTVFGIVMARPLLMLMKTPEDVLDQAVLYMRAVFCGMPANMLYNYLATILRSSGDSSRPLAFLTVAGVANVLLNLLMVIVFRTGALGVGVATAVSHWISCILIVIYMTRIEGPCKIERKKLRITGSKLKKILLIGLPAGIQGTLFAISNVIIQSSINSFGTAAVAGNTAASNIDTYVYLTQNALYHSALTFVGQNMGAKRLDRVKKSILLCTAVVVVIGLVLGNTAYLFGEQLLGIFAPDSPEVIDAGMVRLRILCTMYFLCGLMEVGCGVLRGFGKSITPMIISLLGACALRLVYIYTVFEAFPTPFVLYLSYPITQGITAVAHFVLVWITLKKINKTQAVPQEADTPVSV